MPLRIFIQRAFMPFALAAMLISVFAGLNRMEWSLPFLHYAGHHGGIMVGSFLGTLIILERAVVYPSPWALLAPLLNLSSLFFFLSDLPQYAAIALFAGGLAMVFLFYKLSLRSPGIEQHLLTLGAIFYTAGNLMLVLTESYPRVFPFWFCFFLFVIAGERLELSRFLDISEKKKYLLIAFLALCGISAFLPFHGAGSWLLSVGIACSAIWLLKFDMARKSIRKPGAFRFTGLALITGYFWLLFSALIIPFWADFPFGYDAVLHTFFIGFVFNMIFAHAPIILPAVTKFKGAFFHPSLYFWLILLQAGLLLRIIGDMTGQGVRNYGGMVNGIAVTAFFINMMTLLLISNKRKP